MRKKNVFIGNYILSCAAFAIFSISALRGNSLRNPSLLLIRFFCKTKMQGVNKILDDIPELYETENIPLRRRLSTGNIG
jgi:hypothetical protein